MIQTRTALSDDDDGVRWLFAKEVFSAFTKYLCTVFGCNNSRNKSVRIIKNKYTTFFHISSLKCSNLTSFPLVLAILATTTVRMAMFHMLVTDKIYSVSSS